MADLSVVAGLTGLVEGMQKGIQYQNQVAMQLREMSMRSQERELERRFRTQATERQEKFRMSMFDKEKEWQKELQGIQLKNQKSTMDYREKIRKGGVIYDNEQNLKYLKESNNVNLELFKKKGRVTLLNTLELNANQALIDIEKYQAKGDIENAIKLKYGYLNNKMVINNINKGIDPAILRRSKTIAMEIGQAKKLGDYSREKKLKHEQDLNNQEMENIRSGNDAGVERAIKQNDLRIGSEIRLLRKKGQLWAEENGVPYTPGFKKLHEREQIEYLQGVKDASHAKRLFLSSPSGDPFVDALKKGAISDISVVGSLGKQIDDQDKSYDNLKLKLNDADTEEEKKYLKGQMTKVSVQKVRLSNQRDQYQLQAERKHYEAQMFSSPFAQSLTRAAAKYTTREEGKKFNRGSIRRGLILLDRADTNQKVTEAGKALVNLIPSSEIVLKDSAIRMMRKKMTKALDSEGRTEESNKIKRSLRKEEQLETGRAIGPPELTETKKVTPKVKRSLSEALTRGLGPEMGPMGEAIENIGEAVGKGYRKFESEQMRGGPLRDLLRL